MGGDWFKKFEVCNAEFDVLIDEERYPEIWERLPLPEEAYKVWNRCFSHESCSRVSDTDWDEAFSLKGSKFPLKSIKIGQDELEITSNDWSALLWAKRLRAKIQEKNTDCYERRLDDLVGYLERNLPEEPKVPNGLKEIPNSFKLYFYYLMELSATSLDYEQIGYAKRASRLLHRLPVSLYNLSDFPSFASTAERWIKYTEGMAYRHLGQNHLASLEFSDLIYRYNPHLIDKLPNREYYLGECELNLFYYPAIMNRAIIQIELQFPYDSLKTLCLLTTDHRLSNYKSMLKDLYSAQALRMLERRKYSWEKLSKLGESLFSVKFSEFEIPKKTDNGSPVSQGNIALKTRFVELAMNEYMEIVKGVGYPLGNFRGKFRSWIEKRTPILQDQNLNFIEDAFKNVNSVFDAFDNLWPWVKSTRMDRHGYYQQFAELLAWSAKAISRWEAIPIQHTKNIDNLVEILKVRIDSKGSKLLNKICIDDLTDPQCSHCIDCSSINTIKLVHFDGEALESFEKDITAFLSHADEKWFKYLNVFKKDFADAVAKREETKGEDLHIERLKLRNKLGLFQQQEQDCKWCMDGLTKSAFDKFFANLSPCRKNLKHLVTRGRFFTRHSLRNWCKVLAQEWQRRSCETTSDIDRSLLSCEDYDQIMSGFEQDFDRRLSNPSQHKNPCEKGIHFLGLQRWNSISPAEGSSLGGGYLLYRTRPDGVVDLGIAIDPGFDFIRNLFHCGFSLADIDIILLSHGHLDHIRDFESMVGLLRELDRRTGQSRQINVILTLGTYRRLHHVFTNQILRRYVEPLVIDIEKDIDRKYFENLGEDSSKSTRFLFFPSSDQGNGEKHIWRTKLPNGPQRPKPNDLVIWPTRAYHDDYTQWSDSFGFKIQLPIGDERLLFGYTGDTKWVGDPLYPSKQANYYPQGVAKQYSDCDVLLIHLGSLIDHRNGQRFSSDSHQEKKKLREKCVDLVRDMNHPYLPGLIGFLNSIWESDRPKPGLLLLGEFGEELRGQIRTDLVQRLREVYGREILPVDIGLDVACKPGNGNGEKASKFEFWCVQCCKYHPIHRVSYQHFGQDEALFYLCQTCKKTTSPDVLQERLKHVYELGQPLRTYDSDKNR
jgi:hypothetical protein